MVVGEDVLLSYFTHVQLSFKLFRLKADLKKKQKDEGLPMKNLIGECTTRWGSKYEMVARIFENKQPVQQILQNGNVF